MSKNIEPITFLKRDDDDIVRPMTERDFRPKFSDPRAPVTPPGDNDDDDDDTEYGVDTLAGQQTLDLAGTAETNQTKPEPKPAPKNKPSKA